MRTSLFAGVLSISLLSLCCTHVPVAPPERPTRCFTTCGMQAVLTPSSCQDLKVFEARVLASFEAAVPGWTRAATCPTLAGWTLMVRADADRDGCWGPPFQRICGLTDYDSGVIFVGLETWGDSSLAHEMAHVISGELEDNGTHIGWSERGICAAINQASDHFHCNYQDPSTGGPRW